MAKKRKELEKPPAKGWDRRIPSRDLFYRPGASKHVLGKVIKDSKTGKFLASFKSGNEEEWFESTPIGSYDTELEAQRAVEKKCKS